MGLRSSFFGSLLSTNPIFGALYLEDWNTFVCYYIIIISKVYSQFEERRNTRQFFCIINIICYSVLYAVPFCNIGRMLSPTPVNAGRKQ